MLLTPKQLEPELACTIFNILLRPLSLAVFAHRTATDWMFFVCHAILSKNLDVCEKPRRPAVSEILEPLCLAPTIIPRSKSLRSLVLPILMFNRTVTECLNACLLALYSKPWPRDSLSVGANHFHEWGGVPNTLATDCRSNLRSYICGRTVIYHMVWWMG